jgi:hypothetical protein
MAYSMAEGRDLGVARIEGSNQLRRDGDRCQAIDALRPRPEHASAGSRVMPNAATIDQEREMHCATESSASMSHALAS